MLIKIIGSGGCVSTPKPTCQCSVCREARKKGSPYARCGCSLFIEDVNILIDTPEDIVHALNAADIKDVEYIFYSHADPDHTMGIRVIEDLRLDWLAHSIGQSCERPLCIGADPIVMQNLRKISTAYGSIIGYFEYMHLATVKPFNSLDLEKLHIDLVPVDASHNVSIFVFTEGNKKLVYAPCDVKPFPQDNRFFNADCLIIGNTMVGESLKDGFVPEKDNPQCISLFSMEEISAIKKEFNIKRVIITHLEEDWGKSYDDYLALQNKLDGIEFAYDGLILSL